MIFIVSSGLGNLKRGMESHARDLFDNLEKENLFELRLLKGGGKNTKKEIKIWNLPLNSKLNHLFSSLTGKSQFKIQNLTFFFGLIPILFILKPTVIYLGEPPLYNYLSKLRKRFRNNFTVIFYTGGQTVPANFESKDILQYVAPLLKNNAHQLCFTISHFINLEQNYEFVTKEEKMNLRKQWEIPLQSKVVISVGSIDDSVKRMGYLINEFRILPDDFFLIIIGEVNDESDKIIEKALRDLPEKHLIKTVRREEVNNFYRLADIFVLCSLKEGFGLVYIEALSHGLPIIAHDFVVSRYVLEDLAYFDNLEIEGKLSDKIRKTAVLETSTEVKKARREHVNRKYNWQNLKKDYIYMIKSVENP